MTHLAPKTQNYYTTSDLLKPCPFCGNPVNWVHTGNSNTRKYKVVIKCPVCNVKMEMGGLRLPLVSLEEKILHSWNKRLNEK